MSIPIADFLDYADKGEFVKACMICPLGFDSVWVGRSAQFTLHAAKNERITGEGENPSEALKQAAEMYRSVHGKRMPLRATA